MTQFWKLSAAGFAATAITYGPARMGFGLFLSEFRSSFSISTQMAGVVSSLGFLGFLAALLVAQALVARYGPRLPVLLGLILATLGMGLVAAAPGVPALAAGVFLAMSSTGFSWAPFNAAVQNTVPDEWRPAALSTVSTGTGLGIALAGVAALITSLWGISWRLCWAAFAGAALLAMLADRRALGGVAAAPGRGAQRRWRGLLQPSALPLFLVALSFGTTSAIYISFAADRIAGAGGVAGLPAGAAPALVFISYGVFGMAGLFAGRMKAAVGLAMLLRLVLLSSAVSLALVALAPNSWVALVLSAGLQGLHVMTMSAVLAFWSERLFPTLPSQSFTAALLAVASGSVVGPVVAGVVSDAAGPAAMFGGAAAISLATAAALRPGRIRERADDVPAAGRRDATSA